MPPKAYVAGPFFCPRQRDVISSLEILLPKLGIEIFSPRLHCTHKILKPDSPPEHRLKTFQENVGGIESSNFVLVYVDGMTLWDAVGEEKYKLWTEQISKLDILGELHQAISKFVKADTGTMWEFGGSFFAHKPIISFTNMGAEMNVMLSEAVVAHCKGYEELAACLTQFLPALSATPEEFARVIGEIQAQFKYHGKTH